MSEDLKISLERLHEKQDEQTTKISALEVTTAKQEANMDNYMRQSDRMAEELRKLNENMAVYNAELKIHIAGVMELKEMNRLMNVANQQREDMMNDRMAAIEKPRVWISTLLSAIKWSAPIIAALAAVAGLILNMMGKF